MRFGVLMDARAFCGSFFDRYNTQHRHSGIGMMIPETVHYGLAKQICKKRQHVLSAINAVHPERFVRGMPSPPPLPEAIWIIPPRADPRIDHSEETCREDRA